MIIDSPEDLNHTNWVNNTSKHYLIIDVGSKYKHMQTMLNNLYTISVETIPIQHLDDNGFCINPDYFGDDS